MVHGLRRRAAAPLSSVAPTLWGPSRVHTARLVTQQAHRAIESMRSEAQAGRQMQTAVTGSTCPRLLEPNGRWHDAQYEHQESPSRGGARVGKECLEASRRDVMWQVRNLSFEVPVRSANLHALNTRVPVVSYR